MYFDNLKNSRINSVLEMMSYLGIRILGRAHL